MNLLRRGWRAALPAVIVMAAAACGSWQVLPRPAPIRSVHVALLHTGKVLMVAGSGADQTQFDAGTFKTSLWDPVSDTYQAVSTPWDAFCSGHAFLPDGRLLVSGGTSGYPTVEHGVYAGSNKAYIFDPVTAKYVAAPDTAVARWYPSDVELGNGNVFTVAGFDENRERTSASEIFDGTSWSAPQAPPAAMSYMPAYPALHLMQDGRLFFSGASVLGSRDTPPGLWNINTNAYQPIAGLTNATRRDEGMSVLLPPAQDQKVMIFGGGKTLADTKAVKTTAIVDFKAKNPRYRPGPPMDSAKLYVSAVILPDSTVFETGGALTSVNNGNQPVYSAEIYDPKTNAWSKAATPTVPRVYHSEALLLPDGRVATFGGNPVGSFEMRVEIYSPKYLSTGTPRPTIASAPTEITYGGSYAAGTTQASALRSAVLVRPEAVTHSNDSNQRLVRLPFTTTADGISFTVPGDPDLAPPGWYMLFVVDHEGVPSVASWVHLT